MQDIKKIAIAGAGIMGSSIAQIFAKHGYDVAVYDLDPAYLDKSRGLIDLNQRAVIDAGDMTEAESAALLARITHTTERDCFATADLVIEAITEKMEVKHRFWKETSEMVRDDAILTTNTSGLSITEIAEVVRLPERFCGMHWINPPHILPLVEVIKGARTADDVARTVCDISVAIGRKPVLLEREVKGFLINRFQFAILREALHLVDERIATKEDIDAVFKYGLGPRYACLGPFEIADIGGLDTFYSIASYLFADLSNAADVSDGLQGPARRGEFGVKSGRGFYDYADGRGEAVLAKRDRDFLALSGCLFGEKQ